MKKIVILHSDVPPDAGEDELDCLRQAQIIAGTIAGLGDVPIMLPFVLDLNQTISKLREIRPDVVFNLVETLAGKGAMVYFATALLDYLRFPYTGNRTQAMFVTSDKPLSKKMMHENGIATPPWILPDGRMTGGEWPGDYLMKPAWEDASVGVDEKSFLSSVATPQAILSALHKRQQELGLECFAESYIDGREFNIALLASDEGVLILPPAEILFVNYPPEKLKMLDYRAKWVENSFEYDHTVRNLNLGKQDAELMGRLREAAMACWKLFGLKGYARVDFRVDKNGKPWVLEVNANPCLSPDAGFAAALEHAGIKYSEAIDDIIRDAFKS